MTTTTPILLHNINIATLDDANRVLLDHAILIENGTIRRIGPSDRMKNEKLKIKNGKDKKGKKKKSAKSAEIKKIDGGGRLLVPGFINAHAHLYGAFARGMSLPGAPPKNFLQILQRLWWRLDKALDDEAVYWSGMTGLVQALRRGTTTVIDHHASPNAIAGSLDRLADAFTATGLRGCLCYEVSDRDGPARARQGIGENLRFIERCRKGKDAQTSHAMLAALFGLHASFTLKNSTLRACAEIADTLDAGFHVHVAEDPCDNTISQSKFKKRAVPRLAAAGMLSERAMLGHCIHVTPRELDTIRDSGAMVAHNPRSNMNNAVGVADVAAMLRRGIPLGLGTDGMSFSQQEEMLTAFLLHKSARGDSNFGWSEVFEMGVRNNQRIARRIFGLPRLGAIQTGAPADLALLDYWPPTPLSADTLAGHLFFGILYAPVFGTIINGEVRFWEHEFIGLDEAEIAAKSTASAKKVWQRLQ